MFWKQLYLLLWKNWILRKRHPIRTVIEVLWPLVLLIVLVAIRQSQEVETKGECHYPARAMPSAGVYPWFKSLLCDIQNPCFSVPVPSETPGQINAPLNMTNDGLSTSLFGIASLLTQNTSIFNNITKLANDLQTITNALPSALLSNATALLSSLLDNETAYQSYLQTNMSITSGVTQTIVASRVTFIQASTLAATLGSRIVVCNETSLNQAMQFPVAGLATVTQVSTSLCNLTDAQLTSLTSITAQNLGNITVLNTKFISQGIVPVNPTLLLNATNQTGFNQYLAELAQIQGPLLQLLSVLNQNTTSTNLLSSLLGVDLSSENAMSELCGHPENKTTVLNSFATQGLQGAVTSQLNAVVNESTLNQTSVEFCDNLIGMFENNSQLTFLWDTVKPLLLGKIPYSPHTPLTEKIIKAANRTFESIAFIQFLGESWENSTGPRLYRELQDGQLTSSLRALLNNTLTVNAIAAQTNLTVAQLQQLAVFLSNDDNPNDQVTTWKDTYRQVDMLVALVTKLLECVELDKFVAFDKEQDLVSHSMDLIKNKTLWGGIVFLSPSESDTVMPEIIRYKIRQDSSTVTWTTFIRRFFWRPGAGTGNSRVKYYISGFVHLQDLVESAILMETGERHNPGTRHDPTGSYLQNMPYPCFTRDRPWVPEANDDPSSILMGYYTGGYLFLQDIMEGAMVGVATGESPSASPQFLGAYMQQFPYPCYSYDEFLEYLSSLLSLIMTLAWIYTVCITIKSIVYEKEQRLKEVMKMMGLSNGVHWVAWFINTFLLMFISIVFMVIILKAGSVTPFSNMFIVLLWLCCFAIATIGQVFLISCFFSKANLAAACGGIIFFLLYIPYNMVVAWEQQMTFGTKLVACLLSNVAFGYGAGYISSFEMSGDGIQFTNWATSPDPDDGLNFSITLIMMLFDAFLYFLLTWYIENVFPGKYGVPRPWYFFVTRFYWCGTAPGGQGEVPLNPQAANILDAKMEKEPENLPLGVAMHRLRKVYSNGKVAVDELSLNFYEDQITSFLGHNGAGKTTTMSMLTGLFTPTSGTARVYGSDICTELDNIRHQLGFCPQHNVLFGDLTVQEHLELYSGLKNSKGGKEEIRKMLVDVGLPHKKNEVARHLSGGMKRKLSVAVAFVGGSKCVILDEPTAGVDPYARRGIWDLLLAYKEGRTIILSTHHMDEADLLGDRIAIISHGKLKCCGSSLFLKGNYGVGYYLTVVKSPLGGGDSPSEKRPLPSDDSLRPLLDEKMKTALDSVKASDEGFGSTRTGDLSSVSSSTSVGEGSNAPSSETPSNDVNLTASFAASEDSSDYSKLVMDVISGAKVHEQDAREITFVLPYVAQNDGRYAKLFAALDDRGVSYGLTDTSLEEIFLAVAEENKDDGKDEKRSCCSCFPKRRGGSVTPDTMSLTEFQGRRGSSRRKKRKSTLKVTSCCKGSKTTDTYDPAYSFVGRESDAISDVVETTGNQFDDGSLGAGSYKIAGNKLVFQQFKALFIKRFHHARRNGKGFIASVLVPAIFVALALAFALVLPGYTALPPLELQPWMYGDSITFYSNDAPTSKLSSDVSEGLVNPPGIGMRCVQNYTVVNYNDKTIPCDKPLDQAWNLDNTTRGFSQLVTSQENVTCACTGKSTRVLLAECPVGAGGEPTPLTMSETSNPMYNMSGRDVSDWMVKTTDRFKLERYGGLSLGETFHTGWSNGQFDQLASLLLGNTSAASNFSGIGIENFARTENAQVWFDNNGYHSMPTWLNVLNNAALRSLLPPGVDPSKHGIAAINHPLNFSENQVDEAAFTQSATDTIVSICVIFALSFVPASFVLFLIEEKVTKAKHLQFVSGVNQFVYWIANFLWDMVNYSVPAIIVILIFICFQTKAFVSPDNLPVLIVLLFLYGYAITPMMYPASFYFTVPSTAYVVLTCINLFIGINASLATFILELLDDPVLTNVNFYLQRIFLIFPQYCLGRALIDMGINQAYADAYATFGINRFKNPFDFDLVGRNLLALAVEGTFFFILTVFIQYKFFLKKSAGGDISSFPPSLESLDSDVFQERQKMIHGRSADDVLRVKGLSKIYKTRKTKKPLLAVDRMHVGVPKGECFGLLGVNGAGKTTTFKMLTGDTDPSGGDAMICGHSILHNMRDAQQNTGYCPQFEALNSLLTGREHLQFYAKLRGVPPEDVDKVADWGIENFGLKMYASKCAGTYSGGNKRKLSAAIAFIGCPPVVFLDEPTAGMDPMSRRFLWGRIAEAVRGGRCIVLTSHSMEECEALCSRLAIMVNGRFQCIGSPQHLKNRYGEGYSLSLKASAACTDTSALEAFVTKAFPTSLLKEKHSSMFLYQIPLNDAKLSYIFETLEGSKEQYQIEDYSISQTTLDEVFVNFAKMQTDGLEDEYGLQAKPIQGDLPGLAGHDNVIVLENVESTNPYV